MAQFESSDDELPEEVSFTDAKTVALKSVKDALESAKRQKNILKEKRRKRQLLFQEQKKKKYLPEDVLEEIDALPTKKTKASDSNKDEEETEDEKKSMTNSKSLQNNYSVTRLKDNRCDKSMQQRASDFIQSRFYGPGTHRTTNAGLLSLSRKRGVNQGAAVQFANKNLNAKQKAMARKCNKRFQHRNKLVTI